MTVSIENFLKAVHCQGMRTSADTRLSTLAGILGISNAAATDMARKLATKQLVNYTKYKPLTLTEKGDELALKVLRRHRLWELFLYKTLDLTLHEVHREAEQLEHLGTDFLTEKIDKYLGFPTIDPHGDPIPATSGKIVPDDTQVLLSEAAAGTTYEVTRLYSSDKDFFDFCKHNHIAIGTRIWVEKQYDDHSMTWIRIKRSKLLLNEAFTSMIYIRQIQSHIVEKE